jgi:hypothetical protein
MRILQWSLVLGVSLASFAVGTYAFGKRGSARHALDHARSTSVPQDTRARPEQPHDRRVDDMRRAVGALSAADGTPRQEPVELVVPELTDLDRQALASEEGEQLRNVIKKAIGEKLFKSARAERASLGERLQGSEIRATFRVTSQRAAAVLSDFRLEVVNGKPLDPTTVERFLQQLGPTMTVQAPPVKPGQTYLKAMTFPDRFEGMGRIVHRLCGSVICKQ